MNTTAGKLVQDGTGLTLCIISSSSGASASANISLAVPGSLGQAATSLSPVPGSLDQAPTSPSAVPGSLGQAATPTQEEFGSPLILPEKFLYSSKLSSEKFLKRNSRTMNDAEHSSTRHYKEAVTGPAPAPKLPPLAKPGCQAACFLPLLLQHYQDIVNPSKVLEPHPMVLHYLKTPGPPIAWPFWELDSEKLAAAKADFIKMKTEGIIRRYSSPWASPLHLVKKLDTPWQLCGKFRCLNNLTVLDTYPLPNMMDLSARVTRCKLFQRKI